MNGEVSWTVFVGEFANRTLFTEPSVFLLLLPIDSDDVRTGPLAVRGFALGWVNNGEFEVGM